MRRARSSVGIAIGVAIVLAGGRSEAQPVSSPARASGREWQLFVRGEGAAPQGVFADNVGRSAGGAEFGAFRSVGRFPVFVGLAVAWFRYGSETRNAPLSTTIPDVTVPVTTANDFIATSMRLRIEPRSGRVRPYADVGIGVHNLSTTTTVTLGSKTSCPLLLLGGCYKTNGDQTTTNLSSSALGMGAGGGVHVRLAEWTRSRLALDAAAAYASGGPADYLTKGAIRRVDGEAVFAPLRTRTDIITFGAGITYSF